MIQTRKKRKSTRITVNHECLRRKAKDLSMAKNQKISATDEVWESGELGLDEKFVRVSKSVDEDKLNATLGLTPVSIRLQKALIEDFKIIAGFNGIGYQPLMRQVLTRFADCERKRIMRELHAEQRREADEKASQEGDDSTDGSDGRKCA